MTAALLALLPSLALGWLAVRLLLGATRLSPAWWKWLFEICLGVAAGFALSSAFYFLLLWWGAANRYTVLAVNLAAVAALAFLLRRRADIQQPVEPPAADATLRLLRAAATVAVLLLVAGFVENTAQQPYGDWDAFSIWNLRAKFLAGGSEAWRFALSSELARGLAGANHPSYPLLLSGLIASTWTIAGNTDPAATQAISALFALSVMGLLAASLTMLRSESAGLLAVLVLASVGLFAPQMSAQIADLPLSLYLLAPIVLLAAAAQLEFPAGYLALAGLLAGFAPWTKNEGIVFLLPFLLVVFLVGGVNALKWAGAGALPGAAITAIFRLVLAPDSGEHLPHSLPAALEKLGEPGRYMQVAAAYLSNLWDMGFPWGHPLLLMAVLGLALGFVVKEQRRRHFLYLFPVAVVLAAGATAFLVSTADLKWHLDTANGRLLLQALPSVIFVYFLMLQPLLPQVAETRAAPRLGAVSRREARRRKQ